MPISHFLGESFYHSPEHHGKVEEITMLANGLEIKDRHRNDQANMDNQKYVLIDTDAGTEDAWALFMALAAHRAKSGFKIVGITTVNGATTVDNVVNNVHRVLNTVHEANIPVYKGMNAPIVTTIAGNSHVDTFHGKDGFGDANLPPLHPPIIPSEHAVEAIIKFGETYPGKLTILSLGPLSNLAMAVKLRPDLKNLVKEIFILGGNVEGMGNVTLSSEFNFFKDPEAAHIVLENFPGCPLYILPWETCVKSGTLAHGWRTNVLGHMRTQEMTLLNQIEAKILAKYQDNFVASGAILAACLINPEVILQTETYHCTVELAGLHTRGMMVVDKCFVQQKMSNATLILDIDQELYQAMLVWAAGGPIPQISF